MIKDERNQNGYSEEYDLLCLEDLAEMAMRYVATEDDSFRSIFKTKGKTVPDGSYSDFSCEVWSLMCSLVRYGIIIERILDGAFDDYYSGNQKAVDDINLRYLGYSEVERLELRKRE